MKKVLHIVLNEFKPDNRVRKEALSLSKNDYSVQISALYKKGRQIHEHTSGIDVYRLKLWTDRFSNNQFLQAFKYIEYTYKLIHKFKNIDIIHCHDTAPLLMAFLYKIVKNKKVKIIYDAHEYEAYTHNIKSMKKVFIIFLERMFIHKVDSVITVSDSIANAYTSKYNIQKPFLVLNTPNYMKADEKNIFREKFKIPNNYTIFLYQGLLGKGRGLENTIEAFKRLENKKVVVIFMGYGELENMVKDTAKKFNNIYYHSFVHPDELLNYTSSADFGLNLTINTCLSRYYALPNKLFEYTMAEIPSIVSDHYERSKFVRDYKIGLVVKDNDIDDLVSKIEQAQNIEPNYYSR